MSFSRLSTVARGILRTCAIVLARTGEHATVRNKIKSQWIDRSGGQGANREGYRGIRQIGTSTRFEFWDGRFARIARLFFWWFDPFREERLAYPFLARFGPAVVT